MNNMIMLQHSEIKASFETSTHVVGHVFKVTLYKRLLGMVSRYALIGLLLSMSMYIMLEKILLVVVWDTM